jgi:hypothetical protein
VTLQESGKKAERKAAAQTASEKFTVPAAPPRLVVNHG